MSDFVDLTISDSDGEARRPAKRHRRGSSSSLDAFETAPEAESDDVVLVERSEQEEQAQRQRERHVDLGDEELAVLGERGEGEELAGTPERMVHAETACLDRPRQRP